MYLSLDLLSIDQVLRVSDDNIFYPYQLKGYTAFPYRCRKGCWEAITSVLEYDYLLVL